MAPRGHSRAHGTTPPKWQKGRDAFEITQGPRPLGPPKAGYSLTEARANFDARGMMFRPDDPQSRPFEATTELRRQLMFLLDRIMTGPDVSDDYSWQSIAEIRQQVLKRLG